METFSMDSVKIAVVAVLAAAKVSYGCYLFFAAVERMVWVISVAFFHGYLFFAVAASLTTNLAAKYQSTRGAKSLPFIDIIYLYFRYLILLFFYLACCELCP
ncbi:MAG: hypothetical protein ACOCWI_02725 [Bacillota bacterium]